MTLVIQGLLETVRQKVQWVLDIITRRSAEGFAVFQSDEEWQYVTHPELGRVCPLCNSYDGTIFSGDQIPIMFQYYTYNNTTPFVARPRTHQPDLSQYFYEECHCDLIWLNPSETLKERLHEELEVATA